MAQIDSDNFVSDKLPTYKQRSQTRRFTYTVIVELFTTVKKEIIKHADISEGIIIDRQHLTNLRFVDAAALFN